MCRDDGARIIHMEYARRRDAFFANTRRAMAITTAINRLTFDDADEIRALFSELTGRKVDDRFGSFRHSTRPMVFEIRVGHRVFINQNCTLYDLAGISIGDDVMIGPNVSIITEGHPVAPSTAARLRSRKTHRD